MDNLDAATLANQAVRLGLLTTDQVNEGWQELGKRNGDPELFLRIMERKGHLSPWQSSKLIKEDETGYFLGGYRLLYKIAAGSFGRVYRADDPRTGRIVAIKVLRRKWSEDPHNVDLFMREGKMGMTFHHPNIVEILGVNQEKSTSQYYIVMEFVEGGNLRDIMSIRKKIDPIEALHFLDDCTAGLAYAFSRGVTHRDMKLSNILISSQRQAKLVDFGLAGVLSQATPSNAPEKDKEKDDEVVADRTVDYVGLETATGVPPGDTRSDIFFLGCVAYHMLTGRPPMEMTRSKTARMQPERFFKIKPFAKEEVQGLVSVVRLVENMMSLDPNKRFQTPSQLLDAVRLVRREVDPKYTGAETANKNSARTIFIAEKDARLQDIFREKFKEKGFRVLIAADPARALDRFSHTPYDMIIVDAGTTDEQGLYMFERILNEAQSHALPCSGILILGEDQAGWENRIRVRENQAILHQPVKLKQLFAKIGEMLNTKMD